MIVAESLEEHFNPFVILSFRSSAVFFGNSGTEMFVDHVFSKLHRKLHH